MNIRRKNAYIFSKVDMSKVAMGSKRNESDFRANKRLSLGIVSLATLAKLLPSIINAQVE